MPEPDLADWADELYELDVLPHFGTYLKEPGWLAITGERASFWHRGEIRMATTRYMAEQWLHRVADDQPGSVRRCCLPARRPKALVAGEAGHAGLPVNWV
jgi:hypothetical protein